MMSHEEREHAAVALEHLQTALDYLADRRPVEAGEMVKSAQRRLRPLARGRAATPPAGEAPEAPLRPSGERPRQGRGRRGPVPQATLLVGLRLAQLGCRELHEYLEQHHG
jgi:hypothetical protein